MWRAIAAGCWCVFSSVAFAADNVAVLTILEGNATLVRESNKFRLAEGTRLNDEDLIDVAADSFVQIEFGDGVRLAVGPATRLQVGPKLIADRKGSVRPARFYVMNGWAKVTPPTVPAAKEVAYAGSQADIGETGIAVTLTGADDVQVFVESGDAKVADKRTAANVNLKGGEHYLRKAGDKGVVSGRPPADFLQKLPRPFRDSLPPRLERYKDRPATLRPIGHVTYDEVAPWLQADALVRRQFVPRFRSLAASDREFRSGLVAGMKTHPEWDRILFPEKYVVRKPTPRPATTPPGSTYSGGGLVTPPTGTATGKSSNGSLLNPPASSDMNR